MIHQDRRTRRSPRTAIALSYQLQACADRGGLTAMFLADRGGLLMATSAWKRSHAEVLAAKLAGIGANDFVVKTVSGVTSQHMTMARGFAVQGHEVMVCAVGNPNPQAIQELERAVDGVQRILTESSVAA